MTTNELSITENRPPLIGLSLKLQVYVGRGTPLAGQVRVRGAPASMNIDAPIEDVIGDKSSSFSSLVDTWSIVGATPATSG